MFYTLDEMAHVQTHATEPAAVIKCFNLESHAASRRSKFDPVKLGFSPAAACQIERATAQGAEALYVIDVEAPLTGIC